MFIHVIHFWDLDNYVCSFCQELIETQEHLFYTGDVVRLFFWNRTHYWLWTKNAVPAFDYLIVKFGIFMQEKDLDFWLNNILELVNFISINADF